jgi:hypothetical protein
VHKQTESERAFVELCARCEIPLIRVREATDEAQRRPDYEIRPQGHRIIVEVKQFDPNPTEMEAQRKLDRGEVALWSTVPGDRIRKAVASAASQLKALSESKFPSLLVVFDNTGSRMHTDSYAVATAMAGLDVVPVSVPKRPSDGPPVFNDTRSGPKRKMTAADNTSISGIGVLAQVEVATRLLVYHNRYARNPIEPSWLRAADISHLKIREGAAGSLGVWEAV